METICPYCGHKHTVEELDRDAGPICIKCGTDMSKSSSLMSRDEEEISTGFHYNVKKIRWLLGEAREDLVITSVMEYCDILEAIDKASQKIMKVLPLLDNMDEPITERFQLQIDKYNEMIGILKEIQVICESPGEESITEFCDFCRGVMKYRLVEIKEWYCPKCEDEPKEFPSSAEEPTKCCKCSRKMDDPEGWVEGLNNHMWCPDCQPPKEPAFGELSLCRIQERLAKEKIPEEPHTVTK